MGNSLKSLEVSEEKANQRVEEFKKQLKTLTVKLKEAEARAEYAEKTVKKLQKEVDRLEGTKRCAVIIEADDKENVVDASLNYFAFLLCRLCATRES